MHELLIIFDTIEHVNIVSGVALNSLLLFLIRRYSRKDLGEYKTLLTAFAGFDIFLCIVHFVISPKVISYDTTFSVVANSFWESRHITLIYVSIFTVPFAIMNINFLYRYWSIKNPQRLLFFSKPYFKLAVFLYAFTAYSMWHLLSWWGTSGEIDEIGTVIARGLYLEKYNRTIIDGWLLMDHWRNDEFNVRAGILLITVDIIMITSLTVASILGSLTFYFIYKAKTLSMAFRSFQVKLMSALCAQTFVPFVCVYFPYFCVVTFPFLRIPDPHISDACTMLTSCFPTWDAMVIILLMKDYREGLITLICCRKTTVAGETVWKTATSAISVGVSQISNVSQVNSSVVPLVPAAPPRE